MIGFNKGYFLLSIFLLGTEVFIAAYVHDGFIRPYAGDFLVVILLYCIIRSFATTPVLSTAVSVLLFSYLLEVLQYFHLDRRLGLGDSEIAHAIIGQAFSWADMLAYTLGILLVICIEKIRLN